MATTPTIAGPNSKSNHSPKVSSSTAPFSAHQSASAASHDSVGQRRSGGSGSFGAGSLSRPSTSSRNSQNKKQHKSSKRFRLDDDAIAEQVG
jgi:hypothetical protein